MAKNSFIVRQNRQQIILDFRVCEAERGESDEDAQRTVFASHRLPEPSAGKDRTTLFSQALTRSHKTNVQKSACGRGRRDERGADGEGGGG